MNVSIDVELEVVFLFVVVGFVLFAKVAIRGKILDFEMECDTDKIDLWGDGVRVTCEKLARNAGKDIVGLMDYEMPASGFVGKTHKETSDMHVEWSEDFYEDEGDDEFGWTLDERLAPADMGEEFVPRHTKSPFDKFDDDVELPGMFGQAISAQGRARAVMEHLYQNTDDFTDYFKREWDIGEDDEDLLDTCKPGLRSEGDALWGGIKRRLEPYCAAMPATTSHMQVKHHGKTRHDIGKNALVDWNRADECCKAMALQVMGDDYYGRNKVSRMDYAIDRRKIPEAPHQTMIPHVKVITQRALHAPADLSALRVLLSQHRKVTDPVREKYHKEAVICVVPQSIDGVALLREMKAMAPPRMNVPPPNSELRMSQEFDYGRTERVKLPMRGDKMVFEDILIMYARKAVQNGGLSTYREMHVGAIEEMRDDNVQAYVREALKIINIAYPVGFLSAATLVWNVAKKGKGGSLVGKMLAYLGVETGYARELNYSTLWARVRADPDAVDRLLVIIKQELSRFNKFGPDFNLVSKMTSDMSDPSNPLNAVFVSRRAYWASRYHRSAKDVPERRVIYQLLATVFSQLRVYVGEDKIARYDPDSIAQPLCESAYRYVNKRRGVSIASVPVFRNTEIGLGRLDRWIESILGEKPEPSFADVHDEAVDRAKMFEEDVAEFMEHVFKGRLDEPDPNGIEISPTRLNRFITNPDRGNSAVATKTRSTRRHGAVYESTLQERKIYKVPEEVEADDIDLWEEEVTWDEHIYGAEDAEVKKKPPESSLGNLGTMIGFDDDDDDSDDEMRKLVDVRGELEEDFPMLDAGLIEEAIASNSARVTVSEYKIISDKLEELRKKQLIADVRMKSAMMKQTECPDLDVDLI